MREFLKWTNRWYISGNRPEMRNHYRGHKMSLWLNLIPQLHRPGEGDDVSMRHHHFQEEDLQYYEGNCKPQSADFIPNWSWSHVLVNVHSFSGRTRPQTSDRPPFVHLIVPPPPSSPRTPPASPPPPPPKSDTALQATTTECPPNTTILVPVGKNNNHLLRKLASSHYQSYTAALTVTIAVGCFLLLLNIVIFAGIYRQRDRGKSKKDEEAESSGSSAEHCGDKSFESR